MGADKLTGRVEVRGVEQVEEHEQGVEPGGSGVVSRKILKSLKLSLRGSVEREQRREALQQAVDEIWRDRSFSKTLWRVAEEALQFRVLQVPDEGSSITSLQEVKTILQTLAGSAQADQNNVATVGTGTRTGTRGLYTKGPYGSRTGGGR